MYSTHLITEMTEKQIAQRIRTRLANQPFGSIITRSEFPQLISIVPLCGKPVKLEEFTIVRRKMDQLDQFTVSKPLVKRPRCPVCKGRLDADGSCWWCANPE